MSRKLMLEEVKFRDTFEEISVLYFCKEWQDGEGNYYWSDLAPDDLEEVGCVFHSGGGDDYLYMKYIFKYKDRFYSCVKNENSYGNSGWETDTLKEVHPVEKTILVYE